VRVDLQRVGYDDRQMIRLANPGQLDGAGAVSILVPHLVGNLEREPCLADPCGPGDGREPPGERRTDCGHVVAATDEGILRRCRALDRPRGV